MQLTRYDRASLKVRRDADGFLYSDSTVGRTGILVYRNLDGTERRELRLPEEAGSPKTLASMVGKPVILTHKGGMVNRDNAKGRVVGAMLSARQDGALTNSEIVLHDGEAIAKAERGEMMELSLGYRINLEQKSGFYSATKNKISDVREDESFEPFTHIQRDLQVNHVALVPRGRAGSVARLNLDGDEIYDNEDFKPMAKIKLANGVEVEVPEEVAQHVSTIQTRLDGATSELTTTKGTLIAVQGEVATLKNEVSGFDAKLTQARLDAAEELKASAQLKASIAHKVNDFEGKTDIELKKAFVTAVMPTVNMDSLEDGAIEGAFAYALAANPAPAGGTEQKKAPAGAKHVGGERHDAADAGDGSAAAAEAKMLAKLGLK